MKRLAVILLVLAVSSVVSGTTGFMGKQIQGSGESVVYGSGGQYTVTVGHGPEFVYGINGLWCCSNIDISDTQILVDFTIKGYFGTSGYFNGYVFRDTLDNIPAFTSLTLNHQSTITPTNLAFNENELFVDMDGIDPFFATDFVVLDVEFIPEPATLLLLGLGSLALLRRRRI